MSTAHEAMEKALEAYRRTQARKADELDEAFAAHEDPPEQLSLSNPDADDIGKFQRPGRAAATQREAAIQAYPMTGTARRRVLDAIGAAGEQGRTDEEMQGFLRMNPSTQRPRRVELVEGGWIEDSGRRRRTDSRRDAVVWVLTARGRQEWRTPRGTTWEP